MTHVNDSCFLILTITAISSPVLESTSNWGCEQWGVFDIERYGGQGIIDKAALYLCGRTLGRNDGLYVNVTACSRALYNADLKWIATREFSELSRYSCFIWAT